MKKIMVIEDDLETQLLFSEIIEGEGFEPIGKSTGKEALDFLETGTPVDLIFMDLTFPGGTPEEFTERLREKPHAKDTPIVVISGRADIADYAKRLNAKSFFKKPFDIDILLDILQGVR